MHCHLFDRIQIILIADFNIRFNVCTFLCYNLHNNILYRVSVTTMASDICRPWYCCREYVSFLDTT